MKTAAITAAVILLLVLLLIRCSQASKESDDPASLPIGAVIVSHYGNGWTLFELDGKQYLYHKYVSRLHKIGYESIKQVK